MATTLIPSLCLLSSFQKQLETAWKANGRTLFVSGLQRPLVATQTTVALRRESINTEMSFSIHPFIHSTTRSPILPSIHQTFKKVLLEPSYTVGGNVD
jgi:hypothetical protein